MAVKLKKVASKLLTEEVKDVGRWSRGHASRVKQDTQRMLTWWHVRHVSSHGTLEREHESMQSTFVCEHASKTRYQVSAKARKAR